MFDKVVSIIFNICLIMFGIFIITMLLVLVLGVFSVMLENGVLDGARLILD